MVRPTQVLPSNAPPLPDDNSSHSTRVFQEHPGDRQANGYSYIDVVESKPPLSLLTEDSLANYQPQSPAWPIDRHTALQRPQHRCGPSRVSHIDDPVLVAQREKQARYLYHRFRSSEQYMKYRSRQYKGDKAGQEQKWPDRLELAFFQALIKWPPMGRRQLNHKNKLRGRNELIADEIEKLTGEARCRKQVSSHIQVLKAFVDHDPQIMRYLAKDDFSAQLHHRPGRHASMYHANSRKPSSFPTSKPLDYVQPSGLSMSRSDLSSILRMKQSIDVFQPIDFQMFVQRKFADETVEPQRLHTYTSSIEDPLQADLQLHDCQSATDRQLHGCRSLDIDYPILAAMHKQRALDCNVLIAEASLAFPTGGFRDEDGSALPEVELGISFLCRSQHVPVEAQVYCQNTFYKESNIEQEHSDHSLVTLTTAQDGAGVETQIKFGSKFWAKQLAHHAGRLKNTTDTDNGLREEIRNSVEGINATQEIIILTETGPETLLIIYWKFRLSSAAQGTAYWTRVLPALTSSDHADRTTTQRVEPVYEYGMGLTGATSFSSHRSGNAPLPALQLPFDYDSSSCSAATSATWPSSGDEGLYAASDSAMDFEGEHGFDFNSGNINIPYDQALDLSSFDSSFNFDPAAAEFVTNPALQNFANHAGVYSQPAQNYAQPAQHYSQQTDYSTSHWDYTNSFDSQQSVTGASSYSILAANSHSQAADNYGSQTDQTYSVGHENQAYGGAGQDVGKSEDGLAVYKYVAGIRPHQEHQVQ